MDKSTVQQNVERLSGEGKGNFEDFAFNTHAPTGAPYFSRFYFDQCGLIAPFPEDSGKLGKKPEGHYEGEMQFTRHVKPGNRGLYHRISNLFASEATEEARRAIYETSVQYQLRMDEKVAQMQESAKKASKPMTFRERLRDFADMLKFHLS